ncbi:CBASS cGAMP-activated phospholipase [Ralstonia chuxiongensis]|uniref:Patatin-like phospholipase family protein n=1 Tax=Ralstonia chuxiongensis TaxID=2957504 RepID=A0AA41WYS7_9RALS|nr:CBASS cGAMP-activated phospholipase [Ralstonia chuxiongensis]MCP1174897.1 patatin-like phospholipase family protein [Ralstonia chuxiongensis]
MVANAAGEVRPYRVLSLDGGGVRGLYSALLLQGLAKRFAANQRLPNAESFDLGAQFDLIVGTSTGAILATALAAGVPLKRVIDLYRQKAKDIFTDPAGTGRKAALWAMKNAGHAANSPKPLEKALHDVLQDETVGEMYARRGIGLCVPAVNVETSKSWVFKTPHDKKGNRLNRDNNYRLVDVCLASTAAPMVLPIHGIASPADKDGAFNWFADGGLWANNPSLVALTEALSMSDGEQPIELMSVSTCPPFQGRSITPRQADRGALGWKIGVGIVEVALDAQSYAYDYVTKTVAQFTGRKVAYVRLKDPDVPVNDVAHLSLDNPSKKCLDLLSRLANHAIDLNVSLATAGSPPPQPLIAQFFQNIKAFPAQQSEGAMNG